MKRLLILFMTASLLALLFTACASEETTLPTRAALAEVDVAAPAEAALVDVESTAPATAVAIPAAAAAGERPLLPTLTSSESGFPDGLGSAISSAPNADGLPVEPPVGDLFGSAAFALNATLPIEPTQAQVWRQPAIPLDAARAQTIAQRWGFGGPLYTFATPGESVLSEALAPGAAPLPAIQTEYHVFDGPRSLVITEGAAYYADAGVVFNYESPPSFAEMAPAVETALQNKGLLDFAYTLQDGWGREVWVRRVVDGAALNLPEISAAAVDGRLAFAAYQPFDQLTPVADYPIIPAEAVWQQIQNGVADEVLYTITPAAETAVPAAPDAGFQYWPRKQQSGPEVHLYTYPTVFLPVSDEGAPLIKAFNYSVQTDDDTRRALAEQLGVNVHLWGALDTTANTLTLAGWESLPDLNPLIKNGVVQRQEGQMIFTDPEGASFILPDAPADLADGSQVNVFAWAVRDAGLAYPVLDWEGIDRQVPGASGESLALPDPLAAETKAYEQVTIDEAVLAYYVYSESGVDENGRSRQTLWLLPVWRFSGVTDSGDGVTFYVQATEGGE